MTSPIVLHINTAKGWRGGERQVLWLTERLNAWGVRSIVAARPGRPLALKLRERGLPFIDFSPRGEWDVVAIAALRRLARAHGVNILNSHDGHANTLAAFARSRGQRFIITRRVHNAVRKNIVSRWKFARADKVIAISNVVADVMRAYGVAPERVCVIHSGVDLGRSRKPAGPDDLAALGVTPGSRLAILVGVAPHKDPLTFVQAIAFARSRVPNLQGLILGSDRHAATVSDAIRAAGLGDNVFLTGHRDDTDQLMCASDVVVVSSRAEGLGTAALDAMWARKPLVATRTDAIVDFAVHEQNALLSTVGDAHALGMQIVRAVTEPSLVVRIVGEAMRTVERFSADHTARNTLDLYRSIVH